MDTDKENTCYLKTANRSLIGDGLKIASWTSHLASHLRQLEVGEDKDLKIGGKDCCITLKLRGDYQQLQPDVTDVRYKSTDGDLYLKSALELLKQPSAVVAEAKVKRSDFGLRQLVLETDRFQDKTMRYPMNGFLRTEGVPGSGKTTVALRRIAYVIAQQYEKFGLRDGEELFSGEKTLVIVLNEILEVYLRRLLEELSLDRVIAVNFGSFLQNTFFKPRCLLNDLSPIARSQNFPWLELVKTRYEILLPLNRFLYRHTLNELKPIFQSLVPQFRAALPTRYKGSGLKLEEALLLLEEIFGGQKPQMRTFIRALEQIEEKVPRGGKTREAWGRTLGELSARLAQVLEPLKILTAFAESPEFDFYLNDAEQRGIIKKHHRPQIRTKWQEILAAEMITENDLALATLIHVSLVQGFMRETPLDCFKAWSKPLPIYSHIVLDEIQDLT